MIIVNKLMMLVSSSSLEEGRRSEVLINPFLDFCCNVLSGLNTLGRVIFIGWSEFQMVRSAFDFDNLDPVISLNRVVNTSCHPGVKISISKDDVGVALEFPLDVLASEVVPYPVVSWSKSILVLALLYKRNE